MEEKLNLQKKKREFGRAFLYKKNSSLLTKNFLNNKRLVWMSHEDVVVKLPKNFKLIASTKVTPQRPDCSSKGQKPENNLSSEDRRCISRRFL